MLVFSSKDLNSNNKILSNKSYYGIFKLKQYKKLKNKYYINGFNIKNTLYKKKNNLKNKKSKNLENNIFIELTLYKMWKEIYKKKKKVD